MATFAKRAQRKPRLAYAAEPCDKEIDQARKPGWLAALPSAR
ncbi:hypothetical protein [Verminephrobacter eiseniae]|nr:hypothetical protein [Verminephrobacter eiseniae]